MSYFTVVDDKLIKTYCTESQLTETVNDLIYSVDHPVYSIAYRGHNIPDDLLVHAILIALFKMNKVQLDIFIKKLLRSPGGSYNRSIKYGDTTLLQFSRKNPSEEDLKEFLRISIWYWPDQMEDHTGYKILYNRVFDLIFTNAILSFSKLNKE